MCQFDDFCCCVDLSAAAVEPTQAAPSAETGATQSSTATSPSSTQTADTQPDVDRDSSQSQSEDASSEQPSLACRFCGLDGEPIAGAQYRFVIDGNDISGTTDGNGNAQTKPESDCSVFVQRDDGTFKRIAMFVVPSTSANVTLMSPSALLEGQSEQHGGDQDDVYKEPEPAGSEKAATDASAIGGEVHGDGSSAAASTNTPDSGANAQQASPAANAAPAQSSQSRPVQAAPVPPHPSSKAQATKASTPAAANTALKGGTGKAPQSKSVQTNCEHLNGHAPVLKVTGKPVIIEQHAAQARVKVLWKQVYTEGKNTQVTKGRTDLILVREHGVWRVDDAITNPSSEYNDAGVSEFDKSIGVSRLRG
ncbi:hypothetical protein [Paraburkholderia acidiphila]|uniref:Uncharacterized protein n=1 Tax=Paraburkholderia acidiphila TaxID=2571747 RepID=A0A7Z2JB75_9BURK|nr:hypothetical protein [Paraburkholderia acidiphila]QGZ58702.1 hypothetical protein FAZ97_27400 [Paraburkholderia acidiphila]